MGEKRNMYWHRLEGEWLLGGLRHSWEDDFRVDRKEMEWDDVDSIIWLRIGTNDRFWRIQQWIFRYYKMWGISSLAEDILASQEGLWFMELINYFVWSVSFDNCFVMTAIGINFVVVCSGIAYWNFSFNKKQEQNKLNIFFLKMS